MARLTAILLAAVLAFLAAACGGDDGGSGADEAEGIRVALVTDIGGLNDRGFNALANDGLERAEEELGIEGRVFISDAASDYVPNLTRAARDGYDLVIGVGFLMGDALANVAAQFPDTSFAIVDFPHSALDGTPPNARGLVFAEHEAGYLVGVAAATVAGGGAVSAVGGQAVPAVVAFLAGYEAGAKATDPSLRTLEDYSQDFVDQAKCNELALNQIGRGSKVVFAVAGNCGLGALDAAKQQGVWGVGVDNDQSFLGAHILTSAVKRVDVAVFEAISAAVEGSFEGGTDLVFDLENDGVAVGKISPKVPEEFVERMNDLEPLIRSGEIDPPSTL